MTTECPTCGNEFKMLGQHWHMSSDCEYLKLTEHQKDVITGLVMGDAHVGGSGSHKPRLDVSMITKPYLQHLNENVFPILGTGVRLKTTAKESFEKMSGDFSPNKKEERFSDIYRWQTRRHPELQEFRDWYSTGEKVFPDDIKLSPTVLKHWYCGDGYLDSREWGSRMSIGCTNEIESQDKIISMFEPLNIEPHIVEWEHTEDGSKGDLACDIQFSKKQTEELFEYMGEPLPGFEYKWPSK